MPLLFYILSHLLCVCKQHQYTLFEIKRSGSPNGQFSHSLRSIVPVIHTNSMQHIPIIGNIDNQGKHGSLVMHSPCAKYSCLTSYTNPAAQMSDPAKSRILAFQNSTGMPKSIVISLETARESATRGAKREAQHTGVYSLQTSNGVLSPCILLIPRPRQYGEYDDSRMESPAQRYPLYYKEESRHYYSPTGIVPSNSSAYYYNVRV